MNSTVQQSERIAVGFRHAKYNGWRRQWIHMFRVYDDGVWGVSTPADAQEDGWDVARLIANGDDPNCGADAFNANTLSFWTRAGRLGVEVRFIDQLAMCSACNFPTIRDHPSFWASRQREVTVSEAWETFHIFPAVQESIPQCPCCQELPRARKMVAQELAEKKRLEEFRERLEKEERRWREMERLAIENQREHYRRLVIMRREKAARDAIKNMKPSELPEIFGQVKLIEQALCQTN